MFRRLAGVLILCLGIAHAEIRHVPIKSGLVLKPGEKYVAQIESATPAQIVWSAVQAKPCTANCIQMTQLGERRHVPFDSARGGSGTYEPTDGKITVEYKNISQETVTIDIYQIVRICDAEACSLFDNSKKGSFLAFRIDEFKSITNSKDGSYSVISGVAESGQPFRIHVVWWTAGKVEGFIGCPRFIKGYVENHTPKEQYRPYEISGMNVGDANNIILKATDGCVPRVFK